MRNDYVLSGIIREIEKKSSFFSNITLETYMESFNRRKVPIYGTLPKKYIGRSVDIIEKDFIDDNNCIRVKQEIKGSDFTFVFETSRDHK